MPINFDFHGKSLKLGVLICYEDVFSEISRKNHLRGAQVLLNMTNDAWYGWSSAPYQHLAISVFRVLETRIPLIRAANTGVSAAIDSKGRVVEQLKWFTEGILLYDIPIEERPLTFHSKYGPWFPRLITILVFSGLIACIITRFQNHYRTKRKI